MYVNFMSLHYFTCSKSTTTSRMAHFFALPAVCGWAWGGEASIAFDWKELTETFGQNNAGIERCANPRDMEDMNTHKNTQYESCKASNILTDYQWNPAILDLLLPMFARFPSWIEPSLWQKDCQLRSWKEMDPFNTMRENEKGLLKLMLLQPPTLPEDTCGEATIRVKLNMPNLAYLGHIWKILKFLCISCARVRARLQEGLMMSNISGLLQCDPAQLKRVPAHEV